MNPCQRYLFLRNKGLRRKLAGYCADLPKVSLADGVRCIVVACVSIIFLILLSNMD